MISREVVLALKRLVTTRSPSKDSKVRAFCGLSRRDETRVRRVEDCIAGQFEGSKRSRKIFQVSSQYENSDGGMLNGLTFI